MANKRESNYSTKIDYMETFETIGTGDVIINENGVTKLNEAFNFLEENNYTQIDKSIFQLENPLDSQVYNAVKSLENEIQTLRQARLSEREGSEVQQNSMMNGQKNSGSEKRKVMTLKSTFKTNNSELKTKENESTDDFQEGQINAYKCKVNQIVEVQAKENFEFEIETVQEKEKKSTCWCFSF